MIFLLACTAVAIGFALLWAGPRARSTATADVLSTFGFGLFILGALALIGVAAVWIGGSLSN